MSEYTDDKMKAMLMAWRPPDAPAEAHGWAAGDDYDDDDCCPMCGGDGVVMLSECGPSEWGEDCFCEVDRVVTCPECRERERYEAMRKQQEAKRPNDGTQRPGDAEATNATRANSPGSLE